MNKLPYFRKVLLTLLILSTQGLYAQRIAVSGNEFVVDGQRIWLNGANTPWDNWNDFGGNFDYSWWDEHFQVLKDAKVNSTRVWITCNGEVGINIDDNGYVSGATDAFYGHVDQLMQIAQDKEIYLMVALISFDHVKNSHGNYYQWRNMMNASSGRQSFVDNFVKPFVDRYRDNPYFFAVDVSNEIEWMFEEHGVSVDATQDLVARTANAVHSRSEVLVCQGLGLGPKYASPLYNGNYYSDAALGAKQPGAYLDFYKLHFYGWQKPYFSNPFDQSPTDWQINDKPCVIGEAAAKGSAGYSPQQCAQRAFEQGWQGYMPWTSNGVDSNGDIDDMDDGSLWFYDNYPDLVYPPGDGGNNPPVADGSLTIYQDQLADDWQNWSWSTDVDLTSSGTVQAGNQAVAVTYTGGYGGFSLRKGSGVSTANYEAVELWVHGGSGEDQSLKVYTQSSDEGGNSASVNITAVAGSWQRITIALSELGSPTSIKRLTVQSNASGAQPTIYLDNIQLVGGSSARVASASPEVVPTAVSSTVVVYPNRLQQGALRLRWPPFSERAVQVEVVSSTGQRLLHSHQRLENIPRSHFPQPGLYIVRIYRERRTESHRVLVE